MQSTVKSGVRAIAIFEALKGLVALIFSFILISLRDRDLKQVAGEVILKLRLNPEGWIAAKITEFVSGLTPAYIELFFAAILSYALLRFIEAYGLWRLKAWAQWLGIISGAIYIPIEIYDIFVRPSLIGTGILIFNAAIVAYLYYFRHEQKHEEEILSEAPNQVS